MDILCGMEGGGNEDKFMGLVICFQNVERGGFNVET